jgi:hypothetical protein
VRALVAFVLVAGCGSSSSVVTGASGSRACVTSAACGLLDGVSLCTSGVAGVNNDRIAVGARTSAATVNCLAAAGTDCVAARKCLDGGATPSPCTVGSAPSCAGNQLVRCSQEAGTGGMGGTTEFDCAGAGLVCVTGTNGVVDCGIGSCSGLSANCVGDKLQYCATGIVRELDCGEAKATCVSTGVPHCRGTGAPCSQTSLDPLDPPALRCDGTRVVTCVDGQEASFDCATLQLGCYANVNRKAFGCALGNQCDPTSFSDTCAGLKLSYCDDGVPATFDCGAAGFKNCDSGRCTL